MDRFLIEKSGEQQPEQVAAYGRDGRLGRQVLAVQMIDASNARVRGHQLVGQVRYREFHRLSIEQRRPKRKPRRRGWNVRILFFGRLSLPSDFSTGAVRAFDSRCFLLTVINRY
jgi:hypothetical protein